MTFAFFFCRFCVNKYYLGNAQKTGYLSLIMPIAYCLLPNGALNNLYREYIGRKSANSKLSNSKLFRQSAYLVRMAY